MTELTPLEARIAEVEQYSANIAIYTEILKNLPTEFPEHLQGFKGAKDKHAIIATIENLDDVELLAKLWQADECKAAIRTETLERSKAQSILAVLKNNQ